MAVVRTLATTSERAASELEARYRRWIWDDVIHDVQLVNLTREHVSGFARRMLNKPVKIRKCGKTLND